MRRAVAAKLEREVAVKLGPEVTAKTEAKSEKRESVTFAPLNFQTFSTWVEGTSQLVVCAFSDKSQQDLMNIQKAGTTAKKRGRPPKDFDASFIGAQHVSEEGWQGIVANSFRNSMISAVGTSIYQIAKIQRSVFVVPDGLDRRDSVGLFRVHGNMERFDCPVRLKKTKSFDIRTRPRWKKWAIELTIEFDADVLKPQDIFNLLARAGRTCGVGEGRYASSDSNGLGWGCFRLAPGRPKL